MSTPTARLLIIIGYMAALREKGLKPQMPDYAMVDRLLAEFQRVTKE